MTFDSLVWASKTFPIRLYKFPCVCAFVECFVKFYYGLWIFENFTKLLVMKKCLTFWIEINSVWCAYITVFLVLYLSFISCRLCFRCFVFAIHILQIIYAHIYIYAFWFYSWMYSSSFRILLYNENCVRVHTYEL